MGALIAIILIVFPLWKICNRAGLNPALSLIAIFPFFGLVIVAAILAYTTWPTASEGNSNKKVQ